MGINTKSRLFSGNYALIIYCTIILFVPQSSFALGWFGNALDGEKCDGKGQGFGPYDYFDINESTDRLWQDGRYWEVDEIHTTAAIIRMKNRDLIDQGDYQFSADNLDYTLRAIPNDPRALQAIIDLELITRNNNETLTKVIPPPECYFQRAIQFRPVHFHIRLLYGIYLQRIGRLEEAIEQYKVAVKSNGKSPEAHYNIALALIEVGSVEEALPHAKLAYSLGHTLPGLGRKLRKLGYSLE